VHGEQQERQAERRGEDHELGEHEAPHGIKAALPSSRSGVYEEGLIDGEQRENSVFTLWDSPLALL
jgi:hypothetical protein